MTARNKTSPRRKQAATSVAYTAKRRRVCFVTVEFHGLFKNGGIGTANTALALALAAQGFLVTVAFANADESGPRIKTGDFAMLQAHYADRGITLDFVPAHPGIMSAFDEARTASYSVYAYLKGGGFDIVLFNDNGGHGYYSFLARRLGLFEEPSLVCLITHGPLDWVNDLNALEFHSRGQVVTAYMERRCAGLAEILVSPSRYLLNWMEDQGWIGPGHGHVIQNLIGDLDHPRALDRQTMRPIREIVFFGRQETRKGLVLFCDALDQLDHSTDLSAISITFLGKFSRIEGMHTGVYLAERARSWRGATRIISSYDQAEALAYLSQPGIVAVMPSRAENSPCTVAECLLQGVPFLATSSGGSAELVALEDRALCLFSPCPDALAARLAEILRDGHRPANQAVSQTDTLSQWLDLLSLPGSPAAAPSVTTRDVEPPLVSVCLAGSRSPRFMELLASVQAQSYRHLELIVTSSNAEVGAELANLLGEGAIIIDGVEEDVGLARNQAAALAKGRYLFFANEELANLHPDCLETLVRAALRCQADVLVPLRGLTPTMKMPAPGARRWELPLGSCIELGMFEPCFGEGAMLATPRCFADAGGFARQGDAIFREWLLLAKMTLGGAALEVVPAELLSLRNVPANLKQAGFMAENYRKLMTLYDNVPIGAMRRMLESSLQIGRQHQVKQKYVLEKLSNRARDLATQLASIDPESGVATQLFVQYCSERRMANLAVDFALINEVSLLPEAMQATARANENAALEALRVRRLHMRQTIDLTAELRDVGRPFWGLRASDVRTPDVGLLAQSAVMGNGIAKLAGACPPGTLAIYLTASTDVVSRVRLCAVLCRSHERPVFSELGLAPQGEGWWSGWVTAPGPDAGANLSIAIREPSPELLDLYLIACREDEDSSTTVEVIWQNVSADIALNGDLSASALEQAMVETPLEPTLLFTGEVLSDLSNVDFPIYKPGTRTLLHPIDGGMALVRIAKALPAGACGLRCGVSIEHEKSHDIDFGVWIRPAARPVLRGSELGETENFSGWIKLRQRLKLRSLKIHLSSPCQESMDIYLATRVTDAPNVHFCHAYWHDFWILEPRRANASTKVVPTPRGNKTIVPGRPRPADALPASAGTKFSDATVHSSYLICASPRTGSNLLAAALRKTEMAGRPFEYFNTDSQNDDFMALELKVPPGGLQVLGTTELLQRVVSCGTTSNGVFGATVHWWDLEKLYAAIAIPSPPQPPTLQAINALCHAFFPGLRYIWLRRKNKVAQAISHYLAIKSGVWQVRRKYADRDAGPTDHVEYDFTAIKEHFDSAAVEEKSWQRFFDIAGAKTLELTYEELAEDYTKTLNRVLRHIGILLPLEAIPPPVFLRLADARSLDWERRYRQEAGI